MKILIIAFAVIIAILFATHVYAAFLGEYEQGQNITIYGQFNTETGEEASASHVTNTRCSLFDHNDASSPTASGVMVEIGLGEKGLFKYIYNGAIDSQLASGECVARISGTVGGIRPAALHNFLIVDSGKGPNKRSTLTTSDNIGINWGDVSNPSTSNNLSGTTVNLANTTTTVTNAVTVGTNNDKTGYTVSTNQDKTGYSLTENDVNKNVVAVAMRDQNIATIPAVYGSVKDKLDKTGASVQTVIAGVTVTTNNDKTGYSLSNPQSWDLTGNITGNLSGSVGSLTTNNDKTGYSLTENDTNKNVIAVAMRDQNIATLSNVYGSVKDKLDKNGASIQTVLSGVTADLNNTIANKLVIATAMKDINIASASAVYGSITQKIDSAGASIQTVQASVSTIRTEHSTIIDEIRRNR